MSKEKLVPNIDRRKYCDILRRIFELLVERMLDGEVIHLPHKCGKIFISARQYKSTRNKNGYIRKAAVNWGATKKYWAEHPEKKAEGLVIRFPKQDILYFPYFNMGFRHHMMFSFRSSKPLRKKIQQYVEKNKTMIEIL